MSDDEGTKRLPDPPEPGLPAATALHRDSRSDAVKGSVAAFIVLSACFGAYSVANGRSPAYGTGALIIAATLALLGAASLRSHTCAGPGWLLSQHLVGRSWVRTDQLVALERSQAGVETALTFRDSAGRSLFIVGSDLATDASLLARVHADVQTSLASGVPLDPDIVALLAPGRSAGPAGRGRARGGKRGRP